MEQDKSDRLTFEITQNMIDAGVRIVRDTLDEDHGLHLDAPMVRRIIEVALEAASLKTGMDQ